ncbi:hypothetical protein ABKT18_04140 [Enterobacter hormaechei]
MINKQSNFYLFYYFWSVPCGFYIFGFFPAPYYLSFLLGVFFLTICGVKKIDINTFLLFFVNISYFSLLLIYSKVNVWSYYFIGILTFLLLVSLRGNLTIAQANSIICKTVKFSIALLSMDTILRFAFPREAYLEKIQEQGHVDFIFYGYKHSFLFQDSNFIGLFALSIYFLVRNNINLFKYQKLIICLLIAILVLTFSRAAIISCTLVEFIILFTRSRLNFRSKVFIVMMLFLPVLYALLNIVSHSSDQSFESKFMLIHKFLKTFSEADLGQILFGWGLDNTRDHWGIAAHNLYNTLLLETGLFGFCLVIVSILYCSMINKRTKYHVLSLGIASLSFGLIFTPILIPLALNIISNGGENKNAHY